MPNLKKLYRQSKSRCCKCGCSLETVPGFPLGTMFVLDKSGNYYCSNCDVIFEDGDSRIYDED